MGTNVVDTCSSSYGGGFGLLPPDRLDNGSMGMEITDSRIEECSAYIGYVLLAA